METTKKCGLSGSTLKMIAIISMLIDHIGAGVVGRCLRADASTFVFLSHEELTQLYWMMRYIGRIAFPIFCFLLVEGFEHTRNVKKYAGRLFAFCLVSEIPFDLLFNGEVLEFGYQNVFFTLFIGLLVMQGFRMIEKRENRIPVVRAIGFFVVLVIGMGAAELLCTDYGAKGVIAIAVLYVFRKNRWCQCVFGALSFGWESIAMLAFIPLAFYNGKRGWNMKYFFYIFYPAHLLILYLVCIGLGIAGIPAM